MLNRKQTDILGLESQIKDVERAISEERDGDARNALEGRLMRLTIELRVRRSSNEGLW